MTTQEEIDRSTEFCQRLEDLIVGKGYYTFGEQPDRDKLLFAHWSLACDYQKSILALMRLKYYGGAFALLRPLVEAQIRAHIVLIGSDDDVTRIKEDKYNVNFKTAGNEIDTVFGLKGAFDKFLNGTLGALHSFTHSGLSQIGRRFTGDDLGASYTEDEIAVVVRISTASIYLVTNLITKRFELVKEGKEVDRFFQEWGKHSLM
jgi:hypothetical protein